MYENTIKKHVQQAELQGECIRKDLVCEYSTLRILQWFSGSLLCLFGLGYRESVLFSNIVFMLGICILIAVIYSSIRRKN